jgi:hypothetical protein
VLAPLDCLTSLCLRGFGVLSLRSKKNSYSTNYRKITRPPVDEAQEFPPLWTSFATLFNKLEEKLKGTRGSYKTEGRPTSPHRRQACRRRGGGQKLGNWKLVESTGERQLLPKRVILCRFSSCASHSRARRGLPWSVWLSHPLLFFVPGVICTACSNMLIMIIS